MRFWKASSQKELRSTVVNSVSTAEVELDGFESGDERCIWCCRRFVKRITFIFICTRGPSWTILIQQWSNNCVSSNMNPGRSWEASVGSCRRRIYSLLSGPDLILRVCISIYFFTPTLELALCPIVQGLRAEIRSHDQLFFVSSALSNASVAYGVISIANSGDNARNVPTRKVIA